MRSSSLKPALIQKKIIHKNHLPIAKMTFTVANPVDDVTAFELFMQLEKDSWKSCGKSFYCYDYKEGTWSDNSSEMLNLMKRHSDVLGKYGNIVRHMKDVIKLCSGMNIVKADWFNKMETHFQIGEIAFKDGIYNILTREKRPFTAASHVKQKLSYNAPTRPAMAHVKEDMRRTISELFSDENTHIEMIKKHVELCFKTMNENRCMVDVNCDCEGESALLAISKKVFA